MDADPLCTAACSTVWPSRVLALGFAPWASNCSQASVRPAPAARCSAVHPAYPLSLCKLKRRSRSNVLPILNVRYANEQNASCYDPNIVSDGNIAAGLQKRKSSILMAMGERSVQWGSSKLGAELWRQRKQTWSTRFKIVERPVAPAAPCARSPALYRRSSLHTSCQPRRAAAWSGDELSAIILEIHQRHNETA